MFSVAVKTLQEAIKLANDELEQATQDQTLLLGRLNKVIENANGAVGELEDGEEFFESLGKAIEKTDQKYNTNKDKSVDPDILANIREQYDKLPRLFEMLVNQLYDKKILMK